MRLDGCRDADRDGPRGAPSAPRSPIPNASASPYYRYVIFITLTFVPTSYFAFGTR